VAVEVQHDSRPAAVAASGLGFLEEPAHALGTRMLAVVVVRHHVGCRADIGNLEPITSRPSIPRLGRASFHRLR